MSYESLYGATMCAEPIDDLLVVVHTSDPPDTGEWSRYCRFASSLRESRGEVQILVLAGSIIAGPSTTQRAEFNSVMPRESTRAAILCDSLAARTALTAMSWFNPNIRAFDIDKLGQAVEYLRARVTPALKAGIDRMQIHLRVEQSKPPSNRVRAPR
jgi:hypothetical protein